MNLFRLLTVAVLLTITNVVKSQCVSPTFDNYTYEVVEINGKCWFAENLRTTILNDGTPIPAVTDENGTDTSTVALAEGDGALNLWRFSIPDSLNPGPYVSPMYYNVSVARSKSNGGASPCPVGWKVPSHLDDAGFHIGTSAYAMPVTPQYSFGQGGSSLSEEAATVIHGRGPGIDTLYSESYNVYPDPWAGTNQTGFNMSPTGIGWGPWIITEDNRIDWFKKVWGAMADYSIDPIYNNPYPRYLGAGGDATYNTWRGAFSGYLLSPVSPAQYNPDFDPPLFFVSGTSSAYSNFSMYSFIYAGTYTDNGNGTYTMSVGGPEWFSNEFACIRCLLVSPGCTDPLACNYDPAATEDDETCQYPQLGYDCECNVECWGDFDDNGSIGVSDMLQLLAAYGGTCADIVGE